MLARKLFINIQKGVLIVTLALLVGVVFAEVILRYVLKFPVFGTDEFASLVVVWTYFIGTAHCSYTRTHIEGGLVSSISKSPLVHKRVRLAVLVFTIATCVVFSILSYNWCLWTIRTNVTTTALFFPTIYGEIAMFIGAILMTIYFGIEIAEIVVSLKKHAEGAGAL